MSERCLIWEGMYNARDLGGLPVANGSTAFGRFYRAPRLDVLTRRGWQQLSAAGVRTIVDLRNLDEIQELPVPAEVMRHHRPVEDQSDREFMTAWASHLNSPIYYSDVLTRWPEKIAAAFRCFVEASAGGVLFHCAAGRDRTGMISALLLQLSGVHAAHIAADYLLSVEAMNGRNGEASLDGPSLEEWKLEVSGHLLRFLERWDCAQFLQAQGFSAKELQRLQTRLLAP